MSYCDEHGTGVFCSECMAETMQKTIDQLQAKLAFMTSERDYLLESWVHVSKPAPYTPECYTEISDKDYPPVPENNE